MILKTNYWAVIGGREGDYIVLEGADISCIDVRSGKMKKLSNNAKQVYKDYFAR